MTRTLFLFVMTFTILCCDQPPGLSSNSDQQNSDTGNHQTDELIKQGTLLTLSDAEKILGESAHLIDSTTQHNGDRITTHLAYKSNEEDVTSKKTGVIYFLLEHYGDMASAQKKYKYIKEANEDHGIDIRNDLGDEAYFHTDSVNFYFIMVRKGEKVFNMKVNKITSKTSLNDFNLIASKITATL